MIYFTRRRDIMGTLVNRMGTSLVAVVLATAIVALNLLLLYDFAHTQFGIPGIPGIDA
jgi:manganese transport protein